MEYITENTLWDVSLHYLRSENKLNTQKKNMRNIAIHLNYWFDFYKINTKLRKAHFLAQCCVETNNFLSITEKAKNNGLEYVLGTRKGKMLGNTEKGDGPKYIGRGLLHITGRYNYQKFSDKFNKDYVKNPESLSSNPYVAVKAACYFWDKAGLNSFADKDDITSITKKVNGGYNGLEERKLALARAKRTLGV